MSGTKRPKGKTGGRWKNRKGIYERRSPYIKEKRLKL